MTDKTQAVVKSAPPNDVRALIESPKFREEVAKVLPKHVTPERMARIAMTAVMKTPALLTCTRESVLNCLMLCSQAGLEPDGRLAHLIPFGNTCQVIFDYKGLVALALRNGYEAVYADRVCEGDVFDAFVENGEKKLTHRVDWKRPRGEAYAYYAVCQRNGTVDFEVMTREEVDAIRARSRAGKSGPWVTDYDEMGKKSVLRRMSKRWDLMPEIRDVINADDDTPPAIGASTVTAPIFTAKPDSKAIEAPPSEQADPLPSATIKDIRAKLTKAKLSEGALVEYLCGLGVVEDCKTLEDCHAASETVLGLISDQFDDLVARIKEVGK